MTGQPGMSIEPADHADCATFLRDGMARLGIDIHVSTEPPLVVGPYPTEHLICPHGTRFYYEPTGEQIAQWVKDGAP